MVASGSQRLSNVARGEDQDYQDSDFYMTKLLKWMLIYFGLLLAIQTILWL